MDAILAMENVDNEAAVADDAIHESLDIVKSFRFNLLATYNIF